MRLHVLAFMFVSLPLAGVLATAQSAAPPRAAAAAIVVDAMDRTIDPCTNFYAFACGGWLAHNPVPGRSPEVGTIPGSAGSELFRVATNPHSSNMYRVKGVVSSMPEFEKAFSCNGDAPMVRQNACRVW